jgi:hypothetical protein
LLPNEASNLTLFLGCLIPLALFVMLFCIMRRIGQVIPLWMGIITIIFYTLVIGFLFFTVVAPVLADLNRNLVLRRIQTDLDAQCGVCVVNVASGHYGHFDDSGGNTWSIDKQTQCSLSSDKNEWTCTCP